MNHRTRHLLLASVCATAGLVTGCGSSGASHSDAGYHKNLARYAMPMDQFGELNVELSDYAVDTLVKPCMEQAGFSFPLPDPPSAQLKQTADFNAVGRRIFDRSTAQHYGYHMAPDDAVDAKVDALNQTVVSQPGAFAKLRKCQAAAKRKLPSFSQASQTLGTLASNAYEAAKDDSQVKSAAAKWHACMGPVGVSDLPDDPMRMPSTSLQKQFNLLSGSQTSAPSAREVKIATADADCRSQSGYTKAFYDAEFAKQIAVIDDHRDQLDSVRRFISDHNRKAREIVQRYQG